MKRQIAAAIVCMGVAGCASLPGQAPLAVNVPSDCERNARTVPSPEIREGANAKSLVGQYAAALRKANGRIVAVRECNRKVREQLANAK